MLLDVPCKIAAKFRDAGVATGTAFFVSPTTLLTAAHLYDGPDTEIVAQEPGTLNTDVDIHGLFTGSPPVGKRFQVCCSRNPATNCRYSTPRLFQIPRTCKNLGQSTKKILGWMY